jgi:hypothetical protein
LLTLVSERVSVNGQIFSSSTDLLEIEAANKKAMDRLRFSTSQVFNATPMRRLKAEYERMDENLEDAMESTKQGATLLALKGSLEERDVFDWGEVRQPWEPRYGASVEYGLRKVLERSVRMESSVGSSGIGDYLVVGRGFVAKIGADGLGRGLGHGGRREREENVAVTRKKIFMV